MVMRSGQMVCGAMMPDACGGPTESFQVDFSRDRRRVYYRHNGESAYLGVDSGPDFIHPSDSCQGGGPDDIGGEYGCDCDNAGLGFLG